MPQVQATAVLFLICSVALNACAQVPAPLPAAVSEAAKPALPAAVFRARMLTLVDSLKTYEDTNAPHVEQVMQLKLTPSPGWTGGIKNFGTFREGGGYNLWVNPRKNVKVSDVEFRFYPDGTEEPHKSGTQVCSYDADEIAKDLVAKGYTRYKWPEIHGSEIWGFKKADPTRTFNFAVDVSVYRVVSETKKDGRPCLRALTIGHGELR